jgi:hypothetical protein
MKKIIIISIWFKETRIGMLLLTFTVSAFFCAAFAGEALDAGKKSYQDWKRDIIGQKGLTATSDVEISDDMLKELYNNYKRDYGHVQGEEHNEATEYQEDRLDTQLGATR